MLPLKEWLASKEFQTIKKEKAGKLFAELFSRDPIRPIYNDPKAFYSPADGIVLYVYPHIKPTEAVVEIKGKVFTIQEAIEDDEFNTSCIVIGIFMTQYDVHINRMPTCGFLIQEKKTPFLFTPNISMIYEENDIVKGKPKKDDMAYLFKNERRIIRVYNERFREFYYMVQIADRDVDVILNWGIDKHLDQGERFGIVRFGSQVDLIVPISKSINYKILARENFHVEAGIDKLLEVVNS